jgi:predicted nuclease of predicted toxin-antitoxin system
MAEVRMSLLFDENLSRKLASHLADLYPGSTHVRLVGLTGAEDPQVWEFAKQNGFAIVSRDSDMRHRAVYFGHPPKVIWLDVDNPRNADVELILRSHNVRIIAFLSNPVESFLRLE